MNDDADDADAIHRFAKHEAAQGVVFEFFGGPLDGLTRRMPETSNSIVNGDDDIVRVYLREGEEHRMRYVGACDLRGFLDKVRECPEALLCVQMLLMTILSDFDQ